MCIRDRAGVLRHLHAPGPACQKGSEGAGPVSYTHLDVYKRQVESRERFEQLLRADNRNDFYTEVLPVNPDTADQDLRDVLAHGLIGAPTKAEISELLRTGKSNREVALWLSRAYPDIIETMELETCLLYTSRCV